MSEQQEIPVTIAVPTIPDSTIALLLAELKGSINTNFAVVREGLATQREKTTDHENRLRALEQQDTPTRAEMAAASDKASGELQRVETALGELNRWRWKLIGYFAAIATVLTILTALATSFIQSHL